MLFFVLGFVSMFINAKSLSLCKHSIFMLESDGMYSYCSAVVVKKQYNLELDGKTIQNRPTNCV